MLERYAHASVADLEPTLRDWDFSGGRGLLLHGPAGTGKTHAAVALWRQHRGAYTPAKFVSVVRLMQEKRRAMNDAQTAGWVEPNWKVARFVVFDDFDKARWSEWVAEEMFAIIDTLYARCVPIIVTTNHSPRELAGRVGEYTADRLREMVVPVLVGGQSRRSAPSGSYTASHAEGGHGQSSPADGVDAGASHQSQSEAESDGAFARVGVAEAGVGRPSPEEWMDPAAKRAAEAQVRLLVGGG
jgi:hypothetical protein